jgi:hypothetical protein
VAANLVQNAFCTEKVTMYTWMATPARIGAGGFLWSCKTFVSFTFDKCDRRVDGI